MQKMQMLDNIHAAGIRGGVGKPSGGSISCQLIGQIC
jgi:hypothetical protein